MIKVDINFLLDTPTASLFYGTINGQVSSGSSVTECSCFAMQFEDV